MGENPPSVFLENRIPVRIFLYFLFISMTLLTGAPVEIFFYAVAGALCLKKRHPSDGYELSFLRLFIDGLASKIK